MQHLENNLQRLEPASVTATPYVEELAPGDDLTSQPPDSVQPQQPTKSTFGAIKWLGATVLAGIVYLTTVGSPNPAGDEKVHPNWIRHVAGLNDEFARTKQSPIKQVNRGGVATLGSGVFISPDDRDDDTTTSVRAALAAGEPKKAEAALAAAQKIPEAKEETTLKPLKPTLSKGLDTAILSGDAQFFRIFLFDSCDEDGDVVEVLLNGNRFAIVPITHRGATLSVPVNAAQPTTISIRGVRDGGGGVTVACLTSQGSFFMRSLQVGETQDLKVVR